MNAESILVMNIKKNKFMIEGETSMMISDEKAQEELLFNNKKPEFLIS